MKVCNICGAPLPSNIDSGIIYSLAPSTSKYDGKVIHIDFCQRCYDIFADSMHKQCKYDPIEDRLPETYDLPEEKIIALVESVVEEIMNNDGDY